MDFLNGHFFVSNLQNPLLIHVIWGELLSGTLHLKTRLFSLPIQCLYWFSTASVSVCFQTPENSLRRENILQAAKRSPESTAESCVNSGSSNVWLIKSKRTFPSNLLLLTLDQQIQPEKSRESQERMLWERGATIVISKCAKQEGCVGGQPQNTNEAYIANLACFRKYLKIGVLVRLIAC